MSQWDKLIESILSEDASLRFDEIYKALVKFGYSANQPHGGSSHYTFRKKGYPPITIPKHTPLKRVYIEMVAQVVRSHLEEESHE